MDQAVEDPTPAAPVERTADIVVHGPTTVVDTTQHSAAGEAEPASVVAQPMPVAAATPRTTSSPDGEPIPDLKPAIAPVAPVAPVSNEQPSPAPDETADSPEATASPPTTPAAVTNDPAAPMPAPVQDLAAAPDVAPAKPGPKEPNLFDLYTDEDEDEVVAGETPAEAATDDAAAPENESAAAEEPEMTEGEATPDASTGDAEGGETAPPAAARAEETPEEPGPADGEEPSEKEPAKTPSEEADPFSAAWVIPDEPMRRWSDDTGMHHARGWLVEVRSDSVRILKVNGRHTTVARESLSAADRDYVSAVGDRMAAEGRVSPPATTTTAGL